MTCSIYFVRWESREQSRSFLTAAVVGILGVAVVRKEAAVDHMCSNRSHIIRSKNIVGIQSWVGVHLDVEHRIIRPVGLAE